ncbi:MAG: inositol monophosphatase [Ardenticatenaceae bacterium]|nr:inositol monophosphatase [Ardenticatenaceae bacterium]
MDEQLNARLTDTAVEAAREGGKLALSLLGRPGYIKQKGPRDLMTGSTLEVQSRIRAILQRDFPDHGILAEEDPPEQVTDGEFQWVVDPIDGTTNYYRRVPLFAIAIALRHKQRFELGVVYDPNRDELFHASHGRGAFLNNRPIRVSTKVEAYESFIGTDWPNSPQIREDGVRSVAVAMADALSVRTMGSPALGLCYVAAGYLDAYYHLALNLWDVAAGAVILEEAGGVLSDLRGGSWLHSPGHYLATNGKIHDRLVKTFLGFWRVQDLAKKGVL